jgi:hypothetical protein
MMRWLLRFPIVTCLFPVVRQLAQSVLLPQAIYSPQPVYSPNGRQGLTGKGLSLSRSTQRQAWLPERECFQNGSKLLDGAALGIFKMALQA